MVVVVVVTPNTLHRLFLRGSQPFSRNERFLGGWIGTQTPRTSGWDAWIKFGYWGRGCRSRECRRSMRPCFLIKSPDAHSYRPHLPPCRLAGSAYGPTGDRALGNYGRMAVSRLFV